MPTLTVVSPTPLGTITLPTVMWGTCDQAINAVSLTEIVDIMAPNPVPIPNPANYFIALGAPVQVGPLFYWSILVRNQAAAPLNPGSAYRFKIEGFQNGAWVATGFVIAIIGMAVPPPPPPPAPPESNHMKKVGKKNGRKRKGQTV